MNLNMEIGKKKNVYPSKKSINLYYQESASTKFSTLVLDIVFVVVVVAALLKVFLFDVIADKNDALAKVEKLQRSLDQQTAAIAEYDDVAEEYARYSYQILVDDMNQQDRLQILTMLENTVFTKGGISNISITDNIISLSFVNLNLDECAQLIKDIQSYEMVETVEISNQQGNADGTYEGNVKIVLVHEEKAESDGGEQ